MQARMKEIENQLAQVDGLDWELDELQKTYKEKYGKYYEF